jgi:hypothetical protein
MATVAIFLCWCRGNEDEDDIDDDVELTLNGRFRSASAESALFAGQQRDVTTTPPRD